MNEILLGFGYVRFAPDELRLLTFCMFSDVIMDQQSLFFIGVVGGLSEICGLSFR